MKAWNLILFFVCLNLSGFVLANLMAANVLPMTDQIPMPYGLEDIQKTFNPFTFSMNNILYGVVGAAIAGLIGLILRQGTFAIYAVIIWLVGCFLGITQWVILGFPLFLEFLLAGTQLSFMSFVISTLLFVFFFFFLAETLAQRQLT
jgi:hypothetical protein